MKINQAMDSLVSGARIRHKSWPKEGYISVEDNTIVGNLEDPMYKLPVDGWEIAPKPMWVRMCFIKSSSKVLVVSERSDGFPDAALSSPESEWLGQWVKVPE